MTTTPTLRTPRLLLRPVTMEDAPAYQRHFANWDVIRHLSTKVPWPYPPDGAETYLREKALPSMAQGEMMMWAITLVEDPSALIGSVVLRMDDGSAGNRGFWLGTAWQGQGHKTEAVAAVQDFVFFDLGWERLRAGNSVHNARPRRVKQKTGARFVGPVEFEHHEGGPTRRCRR